MRPNGYNIKIDSDAHFASTLRDILDLYQLRHFLKLWPVPSFIHFCIIPQFNGNEYMEIGAIDAHRILRKATQIRKIVCRLFKHTVRVI